MPGYGSAYSPSIRKMEHSRPYRRGFQMANILGDPFALATLSIASLAWFIAFVGTIFGQVNDSKDSRSDGPFPKFAWWSVFYTLLLNSGIFVVIGSDAVQTYHVAVTAYAAAGHVLVASSVHGLIYAHSASREAAAAGFVLLAMVDLLWVFYFGSTPASTPRAFIDSFALTKESAMHQQSLNNYGATGRPETSHSVQPPQMYNSSQHTGFDNSSPIGGGTRTSNIQPPSFANTPAPQQTQNKSPVADAEVVPPSDYPYRAKAIYSYDANPEDANEISFTKHEILEVSDISGRWWQAKKENGETGIAPSNYLVLV